MKAIVIFIIALSLAALLFGCAIESSDVPKTEEQAAAAAENVTEDVGELTSELDEIDRLLS